MTFAMDIAARTIWGEARGEPEQGQRAVAHVLVNRLHSKRWGESLASVCLWRKQFSCWNDSDPNRPLMAALPDDDDTLQGFAGFIDDALSGAADPTGGATHYYSRFMPQKPDWAKGGTPTGQFGNHLFFKDVL